MAKIPAVGGTAAPITGAQIRAARALLNWTALELSRRSEVSPSAIARAEKFDTVPPMQGRNIHAVRLAFEAQGIEFLDTTGLRLRRPTR
jgi:transcriptional regulator with XRE-family HTH domain